MSHHTTHLTKRWAVYMLFHSQFWFVYLSLSVSVKHFDMRVCSFFQVSHFFSFFVQETKSNQRNSISTNFNVRFSVHFSFAQFKNFLFSRHFWTWMLALLSFQFVFEIMKKINFVNTLFPHQKTLKKKKENCKIKSITFQRTWNKHTHHILKCIEFNNIKRFRAICVCFMNWCHWIWQSSRKTVILH